MAIEINHSHYKSPKHRVDEDRGFLSNFQLTTGFITQVILAFFVTPGQLVRITIEKATFLAFANILVAGCSIGSNIYDCWHGNISKKEILTIVFGTASIFYIITLITPSITIVSTASFFFYNANILASAVNIFSMVKKPAVALVKTIFDKVFKIFGFKYDVNFFSREPLRYPKDKFAINRLFGRYYGTASIATNLINEKLAPINVMLEILSESINKKNRGLTGSVVNQGDISRVETIVREMLQRGDTNVAERFIANKISYKETKYTEISKDIDELDCRTSELNLSKMFKNFNEEDFSKTSTVEKKKQYIDALEKARETHVKKIIKLRYCLPESAVKALPKSPLKDDELRWTYSSETKSVCK